MPYTSSSSSRTHTTSQPGRERAGRHSYRDAHSTNNARSQDHRRPSSASQQQQQQQQQPPRHGGPYSRAGAHAGRPYCNNNNNHYNSRGYDRNANMTIPSSRVTPFAAAQAQPAQHGAAVVRSGSARTEGGSVLFFSSVQKRGGAFTNSERETYQQLQRKHAIKRYDQVTSHEARAAVAAVTSAQEMQQRYAAAEKERQAEALQRTTAQLLVHGKRHRFQLSDSDEGEEEK